ncbi:pre-rRNA-processing protein IPI3 [Cryptococcus neoformans C23]|uniref:Pre-rRNA-processing protein IPI3 n=1 Tax=Cryptococcus neoformans (strain H99 / ATCC 208821 / CBS 10515 / FGSC 9487) TaxID=235443 RepID=J9VRF9_CRYN9|nr:pre-rRNA-processing protein IPI3 [Cryptococcus neoformans var. grubii H99]AFR95971.1 pre-rRNA-processing protein IPI3 [Cryptococcus neoformans var. grubii H99]AUB25833.1 pre-rRNA-processing protein IPI3 [Cryptococcus neoformans var. grubii]OWZ43040.1 pre-rRNA-processing protein IPI3 [Cryptococcus neoformans var. grubii C23]|eukprot:XP_012050776.1 pre-rRNA-processing protein IPI3 [Cryptococcus neoformans var. grubii H99]
MAPQELVLSAPSSASTAAIHLHDLLTSSSVHAFKPCTTAPYSLAHVPTYNDQGGAVFAVQEDKALLHVWAWQKDQMHLKLHLPEKMTCFTVSPNGYWAAAGSHNGHIYLWELSSGLLVSSHTGHYRALTSLTFTPDSRLLISTSLDSSTHIYLVSQLIDPEDPTKAGKPYGTLKDHNLAVRCIGLGRVAGSQGGRLWTASDDGTVKMWSLHPPFDLLCTFVLPPTCTPTTLAVDPSERFFYVGTTQGDVYHIPLFRKRTVLGDHQHHHQHPSALESPQDEWEAVGGGAEHASASAPIKTQGAVISLKDAKESITSLALSLSSTHLLVGTSAGTIQIHSLPSHQHLRTLSPHAGPVTHLSTLLRPADLVGSVGAKSEEIPIMEIKPLDRLKHRSPQESHELTVLLRPSTSTSYPASLLSDLRLPPRAPLTKLGGRQQAVVGNAGTTGEQMERLLAENKRLKAAFDRAEKINEKLWDKVMDVKLGTS